MQLVKALLNPTRIRILDAIAESPTGASQLAAALGESLSVVSYHLGVLQETGCVQPTRNEGKGLAEEQRYELAPLATPTRRSSQRQVSTSPVGHPPAAVLRTIVGRGAAGPAGVGLGGGEDHLGCFSIVLDRQGWLEVSAAIAGALDRVSAVHEESTRRLAQTDEEGIGATIAVASFESPPAA